MTAKAANATRIMPGHWKLALRRATIRSGGVVLTLVALGLALALLSYSPADPAWNRATDATPGNWLGMTGAYAADWLLQGLGVVAVAPVIALIGWGVRISRLDGVAYPIRHLLALLLALPLLAMLATSLPTPAWRFETGMGGVAGQFGVRTIEQLALRQDWLIPIWGYWLLGGVGVALYLYALSWSPRHWLVGFALSGGVLLAVTRFLARIGRWVAQRRRDPAASSRETRRRPPRTPPPVAASDVRSPVAPKEGKRPVAERQGRLDLDDGFALPALDLLTKPRQPPRDDSLNRDALAQNARLLEAVLDDFGIKGRIIEVHPGPVVTLYELEPAPGIKSSRVIGLSDDIARSMSAVSARVAVIPGRNVIGIELPNSRREMVFLRELLAAQAFEDNKGQLPLVLGKNIGGEPVIADLAPMPHLLVAGTTGSGKSVGINAMILSLLYRLTPDQCRFIMIDPKMLELSVYDGIPHLLSPVVTDAKKAIVALKWAVREMEDRYQKMSKLSVRNIQAFNDKIREAQQKGGATKRRVHTGYHPETGEPIYETLEFDFKPLPLIVVVVDELADLMIVAGKEVEGAIQRLAQMARAAGIHLILATQRPSVDVITGVIKANLPTRISFQVTSKIDSRTILESMGAEQLLGKGDMLFMQNGRRLIRVHGPFVSDEEVERVVGHLKTQGIPDYIEAVTEEIDDEGGFGLNPEGSGDDLYDRAVALVATEQKASTSFVQRHLQIGYNRAARLIEQMEKQGVVGPANHVGKREVLIEQR